LEIEGKTSKMKEEKCAYKTEQRLGKEKGLVFV